MRSLPNCESFVADTRFDHVGVFTYSHEEGTRAFAHGDDVPAAIKRRRRNTLMAMQKQIVAKAQKARIGTEVDVLVDGPSTEHELVLQGRLEGQAPDIDPVVFLSHSDPGQLRRWPAHQSAHRRAQRVRPRGRANWRISGS